MAKINRTISVRIIVVMLCLIIAFLSVTGYRLAVIMLVEGNKYQTLASEQQLYDSLVTAPRGDIYDRNMQVLATSSTAWTVYITPNAIKKIKKADERDAVRDTIAKGLSEILEVDYETVYNNTDKMLNFIQLFLII